MKERHFDKALKEEKNKVRLKAMLQSILKPLKALKSGIGSRVKVKMPFLHKQPTMASVAVVAFWVVIGVSVVVLIANKLRYEFFTDLLIKNFPEATTVPVDSTGKPLYMSALDRMLAEFEAEINVGYFLFFIIGLRLFLRKIWLNYNPRKRQVF